MTRGGAPGNNARMPTTPPVGLRPIRTDDLPRVGEFLHAHLNGGVPADTWARALRPAWRTDHPDHGFLLEADGQLVGVYAGLYSEQGAGESRRAVCNLAAWCVLEEHRAHSLRLVRAMVGQRDRDLTDLSPSGNVVPTNERLGFTHLDTAGALVVNLPAARRPGGARLLTDHDEIERALPDAERRAFRDHRTSPAARHVAVVLDGRVCWVVFRRVRRKRLPLFASILHVSDRALFTEAAGLVHRHILLSHRLPFTLVEDRICGPAPWHAVRLASQRPKMFLSRDGHGPEAVSYLYSELTQVPW